MKIGELCHKHHVLVVSDEIHCDLTDPGKEYVPFACIIREICAQNRHHLYGTDQNLQYRRSGRLAAVMIPNR